jgi:membrane fusion protein, multidrug efflux system
LKIQRIKGIVQSTDVPEFLSGIGTVQAYNMDLIKTRVDGQITKVNFHEGQEIKEGDPLVEIDPRPYKAVYDQVVAKLETDQATLTNAQVNYNRDAQIVDGASLAVPSIKSAAPPATPPKLPKT